MAQAEPTTDGRNLRRQRNITTVLEATMELFAETGSPPTPEDVAERSGVSVSSIYRYFDSPGEMHKLAAEHRATHMQHLAEIPDIGQGPLSERIDRFMANRLDLYSAGASVARAWARLAERNPEVAQRRTAALMGLRTQTEAHFAPELDAMTPDDRYVVSTALDTMLQVATAEHCFNHLGMSRDEVGALYCALLERLLTPR